MLQCNLLSYYLANKRSLHVRSQSLKIPTLIGENKITHYCHYDKNRPKILLCLTKYSPPRHYKEINPATVIIIKIDPKYPRVSLNIAHHAIIKKLIQYLT